MAANPIEWRAVVGYEGVYEVSNQGHVRRIGRAKGTQVGKHLKPAWSLKRQYTTVILCRASKKKMATVHSLVAEAFIGPRPEGWEINHKDGHKLNNDLSNLEYVSKSANALHAVDLGFHRWAKQRKLQALVESWADGECSGRPHCEGLCRVCIAREFLQEAS